MVSRVVAPLLDFASTWVQSISDYDFIIAQTFPPAWCSIHRPVLSRPDPVNHMVYSAIDPLEPDGHPVFCHRGCGRDNLQPAVRSQGVKVKCILCHSTCEVKGTEVDTRTPLGQKGIHKVGFPPDHAVTDWTPPKGVADSSVAGQLEAKETRGRPPKDSHRQARGGQGGNPVQRSQTHSVPRLLPSQIPLPPIQPARTMSQAPFQHAHPALGPQTTQLQSLPHGLLSTAFPPPPPQSAVPPQPPQNTNHRGHRAKRQKVKHRSPAPPS